MKAYFQGKGQNFGDTINYLIFSKIFNQNVNLSKFYNADYFLIGSILDKAFYKPFNKKTFRQNIKKKYFSIIFKNKPIKILGSGFIEDINLSSNIYKSFREINPIVLRGKKTLKILEKNKIKIENNVTLGDPGILVEDLIDSKNFKKKYEIGIIPHYVDQSSKLLNYFLEKQNIKIINIKSEPYQFLKEVSQCRAIISSSLHGLITADSLGIPNKWIKLSNNIFGNDFKFYDYYSNYDVFLEPFNVNSQNIKKVDFDFINYDYKIDKNSIDVMKKNIKNSINITLKCHK